MLALLLASAAALAGPPARILPLVDRPGIAVAWSQAALARGREGDAAAPACRPFAEDLVLCLTVPEGAGAQLASRADLAGWGLDQAAGEALAAAVVAGGIGPDRPQQIAIPDDGRSYLLSAEGDGLDQAGLFEPERLAARFDGQPFAVAIPARGVLLAVALGDPELEQMVAVGARRVWEAADEPITPVLYAWRDGGWRAWGEARPSAAPDDRASGETSPGAAP